VARPTACAFLLALLAGCAAPEDPARLPDSIAVIGDSISRATNVQGESFGDQPAHAWATGTAPEDGVDSHFERLRALGADIVPFNDARSGARMADLARQAGEAVRQRAQHVVILLGANDLCASPPTEPAAFRAQLAQGAAALEPLGARVLVASVPDVPQLVTLYGNNDTARAVWKAFDVCPGVLAEGADLEAARALLAAYNAALREEAAARGWSWDGGAVFETAYAQADVSAVDFFHPSLAGQARLAEATWGASPYRAWS